MAEYLDFFVVFNYILKTKEMENNTDNNNLYSDNNFSNFMNDNSDNTYFRSNDVMSELMKVNT